MEINLYNVPAYTIPESAFLLRIPSATLRTWVYGRAGAPGSKPLIIPAENSFLSFNNLVEAHVLSAIRQRVSLASIRAAILYCRKEMDSEHPLLNQEFLTDGVDLFVEELERLVNVSKRGQLAIKEILAIYLHRIERDTKGMPVRLFPFTRDTHNDQAPKNIVIDPKIAFGRPSVAERGIPVQSIADQFWAGDSFEELMIDFGLTKEELEEAIRVCKSHQAA